METRKTDDVMLFDEETKVKNQEQVENALEAGMEERQKKKKRKREKKDDIFNGYGDGREMEIQKKDDAILLDKETKVKNKVKAKDMKVEKKNKEKKSKVKNKEEVEDAIAAGNDGRKSEIKNEKMDTKKDDNKDKKVEKKREKKSKVKNKEEMEDVVASHDERQFERKNGKMDTVKADNKEKKKEKKRKEKKTKDDMIAGDEEPKKKVKDKKGNVEDGKKTISDHPGNDPKHVKPPRKRVRFSDELELFPPADSETNANKKQDGLVRGKRFTKEEDEIIKKAVLDYIEANHLGAEGLDMVLHCKQHAKLKYCWKEIGAALPQRPFLSVYFRAHTLFERGDSKWTPEELELVREAYEKHGSNWKVIAKELGKFRVHVKDAWRRIRLIDMKKGNWSQDEYQSLFELVNKDLQMKVFEEKKSKHGMLRDNISWEAISTKLGTRNNASCCTKWYNQLTSPMVAEGKWADIDDYRLLIELLELDASCEDEVDWDDLLEHRSGEMCHTRWQQMVRHLGEHGNKSFSEQVDVLSKRYCPDLLEVRETLDSRPIVD